MRVIDVHALGEEAAGVVRQAASLAARRGHAQVTPLHIAGAMLSALAPAGILRAACLRSQSHPMQHNALDLCLDLALARLAVTRRVHAGYPAPSNACVAALNRAQAHRRSRGEGKVELAKLVESVLDDPSVDRVMRAAGFSSSQVSASVESAAASSEQSSRSCRDIVRTSPNPVPRMMVRAGGGQPSLHTVLDGRECEASKTKSGAEPSAILGGTELEKSTVSIPPWLRRYNDKSCTRSTYCGTGLQADAPRRRPKFTELTATNLKILCDGLDLRVPRHGNIVPGISSTVLRSRSGVARRRAGAKPSSSSSSRLLFLGKDNGGKMAVARELARLVFGSYAEFTALQVQGDPEFTGKLALKRPRSPENDGGLGARLFGAIVENPHRVILIDGVDRLDRDSEMRIKSAITGGAMARGCNGDVVDLEDAIVVLSASDVLESRYVASSSSSPRPRVKRRFSGQNRDAVDDMEVRSRRRHSWDLNVCAMDGEEEEEILGDEEGILNVVDGVFLFN